MRNILPLLLFLVPVMGSRNADMDNPLLYRVIGDAYGAFRTILDRLANPLKLREQTEKISQRNVPDRFPCDTHGFRSPTRPTSVHRLMPGDIDVIGALGDSLTAGEASLVVRSTGFLLDDRGVSWSGGGERTWRKYLTLPNILKLYNPNVYGYATGSSFSYSRKAKFNVAVNGVPDDDLPYEATILKRRMVSDSRVDFQRDWKVISINIGVNDLCTYQCKEPHQNAENHKYHLEKTLDYLQEHFPRTLVNLVHVFDVVVYKDIRNRPRRCYLLQGTECSCLIGGANERQKVERTKMMQQAYWDAERELVESGRYDMKEDFAVVLQPFSLSMFEGRIPENDVFAIDCFHYSQKGNARAANSLWNNMLEPVGNKTKHWVQLEFSRFLCPTKDSPYFFTKANSRRRRLTLR